MFIHQSGITGDLLKKRIVLLLVTFLLSACAPTPVGVTKPHNVYYAGGESEVKTALSLAGYTLLTDPSAAEVFILNGEIPDAAAIADRVRAGAGLVLGAWR